MYTCNMYNIMCVKQAKTCQYDDSETVSKNLHLVWTNFPYGSLTHGPFHSILAIKELSKFNNVSEDVLWNGFCIRIQIVSKLMKKLKYDITCEENFRVDNLVNPTG